MVLRRQDRRGLTTLLFTDIVGSSEVAVELGDRRWRNLQGRHHAEVRKQLKYHGGHEVDAAGDGFFATFGSPAAGARCAFAIVREVRELGLDIRAGLHIGEAELTGEKVGGIAVTTAQRVESAAGPGQVLVTDTIVHLVAGSGLAFTDLGLRELKGVPGRWELFALAAVDGQPIGTPLDPKDAAEARERSSPPKVVKKPSLRRLPVGLIAALVVLFAGAGLLLRDRPGTTSPEPTSGPEPAAVVAVRDGSGAEAFPVALPPIRYPFIVGPIVLTGRADSPTAFAWIPSGGRGNFSDVATINRTNGAVVSSGYRFLKGECPCLASARGRVWYPIFIHFPGPGNGTGLQSGPGISLRGISLAGEDPRDIRVDAAVEPRGISALVSGAGYLWLADSADDQVYRVDPMTGKVQPFSLHQGADLMVFADERLWVLDTLAGKITGLDPKKGRSLPSATVSGNLQGMAVGGGYVWVTDASDDEIQQIPEDLESASIPISVGQIGHKPNAVAYDGGTIVVGFFDGTLASIDPSNASSPTVIGTHPTATRVSSITVDRGIVWAAGPPTAGGL